MPAVRSDVPWTEIAIQAAAGATIEELAEHYGVPTGTIKARSAREGWKRLAREVVSQKTGTELVMPQHGTLQPSATERGLSLMQRLGSKSKLRAAKVGDRTLQAISRKKDDALIAVAPAFKTTVDALAKVHRWDAAPTTALQVNVNLGNVQLPDSK